jgi:hypothetical protein
MLKTFFIAKAATPEIDAELERTMQMLHDRMEKMLESQNAKRQRFTVTENTPTYYR